jgi:hypothetical protein
VVATGSGCVRTGCDRALDWSGTLAAGCRSAYQSACAGKPKPGEVDQPWPFRAVIPVLAEAAEQIRATYQELAQRPDNNPFADMPF